jgi:uncharacterized protein (TIGR02466 family)
MQRARTGRSDSDVFSLFPTFVWKQLWMPELVARVNASILQCIESANPQRTLEPGTSWQSDPDLHERPGMADFVAQVCASAVPVLRFLELADVDIEMTGCWINLNAPGAGHAVHTHPNTYLSGVYYVQTAYGANTVNFHDPRPQTSVLRPPVTGLGSHNADQVVVLVEDGVLLLFPAYLPHSVAPNTSDRLRISVSFNLMFAQFTKRMSAPQWSGTET